MHVPVLLAVLQAPPDALCVIGLERACETDFQPGFGGDPTLQVRSLAEAAGKGNSSLTEASWQGNSSRKCTHPLILDGFQHYTPEICRRMKGACGAVH